MAKFEGFPPDPRTPSPLPEAFFREILPAIDRLEELKVLLYILWRCGQMEGGLQYLWREDILADQVFMKGMDPDPVEAEKAVDLGIQGGVARGTLLAQRVEVKNRTGSVILLNSARGRAAMDSLEDGSWQPAPGSPPSAPAIDRTSIYRLYEENVGPLTPMIVEMLKDAEADYPAAWIEEAIKIAVENNVRRWRYIEAILRSWREEGKDERQTRGDLKEDRHRYVRGKFSEFIEH